MNNQHQNQSNLDSNDDYTYHEYVNYTSIHLMKKITF